MIQLKALQAIEPLSFNSLTFNDFNCDRCVNDAPFYIPYKRGDIITLVTKATSPSSVNTVAVSIDGNTVLSGTGVSTNIVIGDNIYSFFYVSPCKTQVTYQLMIIPTNAENITIVTSLGTFTWNHQNELPPLPITYVAITAANTIGIITDNISFSGTYTVGNSSFPLPFISQTRFNASIDTCFRLRTEYASNGNFYWDFTHVYKCESICDNPSVMIRGEYGDSDCFDNIYNREISETETSLFQPQYRVLGSLKRLPNLIRNTYNSNCRKLKSEVTMQYNLYSDGHPHWSMDLIDLIIASKRLTVSQGEGYNSEYIVNSETNFKESNIEGQIYNDLDVTLQKCKCETVFKC